MSLCKTFITTTCFDYQVDYLTFLLSRQGPDLMVINHASGYFCEQSVDPVIVGQNELNILTTLQ